jgi:hypothetical protein
VCYLNSRVKTRDPVRQAHDRNGYKVTLIDNLVKPAVAQLREPSSDLMRHYWYLPFERLGVYEALEILWLHAGHTA